MHVTGLHDLPQKKITRLDDFFVTRIYRKKNLHELQHSRSKVPTGRTCGGLGAWLDPVLEQLLQSDDLFVICAPWPA